MIWQKAITGWSKPEKNEPCSCPRSSPNIPCPEPMSSGAAPKAFMAGPPARTADLIVSRAFMPWPGVLELVKGNPEPQWRGRTAFARTPQESPDWEQAAQNWRIAGQYTYTASRTQRYLYALTAQDAL